MRLVLRWCYFIDHTYFFMVLAMNYYCDSQYNVNKGMLYSTHIRTYLSGFHCRFVYSFLYQISFASWFNCIESMLSLACLVHHTWGCHGMLVNFPSTICISLPFHSLLTCCYVRPTLYLKSILKIFLAMHALTTHPPYLVVLPTSTVLKS